VLPKKLAPELREALRNVRPHVFFGSVYSFGINVLYLAPSLYMMQVFDRVMSSGQASTLVMISIAALLALITLSLLDAVRNHILLRLGNQLDAALAAPLLRRQIELTNLIGPRPGIVRDLDNFRSFVTTSGASALFDLPWMPIYLFVCFLLHPGLGVVAFVSTLILLALAIFNEYATGSYLRRAEEAGRRNYSYTDASIRNAEVIQAMGMMQRFLAKWAKSRNDMLREQTAGSEVGAYLSGTIRFFRLTLQNAIIAIGAYMALNNEISAGVMFAAGLLLARTMSPIEQLVGMWKSFISARASIKRVNDVLLAERPPDAMKLPPPRGQIAVEGVTFAPPGSNKLVLRGISFVVEPGERIAVIGPSGAGKSTLARLLVGVWKPNTGTVRLDGADVSTWERTDFGKYVGYMPQDVELFDGTVQENIARLDDVPPEEVVNAAQRAAVHELVLRLPNGYETQIGPAGAVLSGGVRQRIGLARALLGSPRLLVLDEPNSNLDADGERALFNLLATAKENGMTTIVISHRTGVLNAVDRVLVLRDGVVYYIGTRGELVQALAAAERRTAPPMISKAR
jgi:PrtD family type I secretion system ABC transporter